MIQSFNFISYHYIPIKWRCFK